MVLESSKTFLKNLKLTLTFPEDGKYARGKRLIYLSISQIQHVPKYHTARRQALLSTLPVSWVFCTNFDCTEKHFLKNHMLKEWDVLREQVSLHQTRMWKTQEGSSQWGREWSFGTDLYDHRKLSCQFFKNLFRVWNNLWLHYPVFLSAARSGL